MTDADSDRSPRTTAELLGQGAAEAALVDSYRSGRLPHAWLVTGPAGIGKATLAYRFARFLFAGGNPAAGTLEVPESHPVFRRVASGGHADLITVERQFDEEKGKRRKDIAVDDVRKISPFLHLTAAEGGWRVVIVDGADGMNRSGQNAVLKILEEPPKGALLMLISERPLSLLPTIRSRCRTLSMPPLDDETVDALIASHRPGLDAKARANLVRIAEGSIGQALEIADNDGLTLLTNFLSIAAGDPVDWPAAHALGDKLGAATADDSYKTLVLLVVGWLSRTARRAGHGVFPANEVELMKGERELAARLVGGGRLERALEVWEKVSNLFARSDGANLDRRLTVISALDTVNAALR